MKWFYDLKISLKLSLSFLLVALIAGGIGLLGFLNVGDIKQRDQGLFRENMAPLENITKAQLDFQRIRINIRNMMIDPKQRQTYFDTIKTLNESVAKNIDQFRKAGISTDKEKSDFDHVISVINEYDKVKDKIINLAMNNQDAEAGALLKGEGNRLGKKLDSVLMAVFDEEIHQGKEKAKENASEAIKAETEMVLLVIVAMVLAAGLGLFITKIITKPVKELDEAALKLALGDVSVSVAATTKDELGSLMASFGRMVDNIRDQAKAVEQIANGDLTIEVKVRSDNDLLGKKLAQMLETNNEILGGITVSAEQVSAGARQVSASSQALSQGSSEQACTIEEMTASISQIATQTKQNAINAGQANELASTAKTNAVHGNEQMKEMLIAMEAINESSSNISKIIKVIDEIAFQTNILALNAAVEAARAGQHGKGFAVVAEEVRNLAARSADAAKETTAMIESSIKKVDAGTKIANETAVALDQIVGGVTKAAELVGDIAVASNEQATAIAQINQGIEQVSQVVQANTATAEESASASEELSSQADLLKSMVVRFKLKSSGQSYDALRGINPDVLRAIEDMMLKKGVTSFEAAPGREEPSKALVRKKKVNISLDDNDFGKY